MPEPVNRRRYNTSNRQRQKRETRRRIVDAAARLFVRDGYADTSIAAIADEAGVAVATVYATLRSKAGILRAVAELTVRGDDDSAPLSSRAAWQQIERADDPRQRLARFARLHRQICDRHATLFAQIEAAAGTDHDATELLVEFDRRRYETQARVTRGLRSRGQLRPQLTEQMATDSLWTLASERTYLALVRDREWHPDDYERWLIEHLEAALLPRDTD
jgi:AcrR family transcriptional regulator